MLQKNEQGLYSTVIDGKTYEFSKWNTEDALDTLFDIGSVVGGPLGALGSQFSSKDKLREDIPQTAFDKLLVRLSEQLGSNRPTVMRILRKLGTHQLFCESKQVSFDAHYKDNLAHLFKVVRSNAEVQYESFFSALGEGSMGGLLARATKAPAKPEHTSGVTL